MSHADIFIPPGPKETGRRMEMSLDSRTGTLRAAAMSLERLFPSRGPRANARRGVARLIGQSEARVRRKIQQVMRQSEWISAELHGTGSEAYDEPARPECTESKSRSNGTCCDLCEFRASLTVSWDASW